MSDSYAAELLSCFGRNFRRRREYLKISQCSLSRSSGIPQPTLSLVEAGLLNLTLRRMVKLASAVGSDVPAMLTAKSIE